MTETKPSLGLPTLAELRACTLCPLAGPKPAGGEAWGKCEVMVIGEAPGAVEAQTGRPFVGDSGRMLRRLVEEAGLSDNVYVTNVVKHRPPGNRPPLPDEVKACAPYLARELAIVKPKVVVLVGETAMSLAFEKVKGHVKRIHGRWTKMLGSDIPCVSLIHPAAILRMPQEARGAWEASSLVVLQQARDKASGVEAPEISWRWSSDIYGYDPQTEKLSITAIDCEATSLDQREATLILAATHDGRAAGRTLVCLPDDVRTPEQVRYIMHHSAYDATILARNHGMNLREVELEDTMVMAHVIGLPDLSLKGLSAKVLGQPMETFEDKFGDNVTSAPIDGLAAYCARDAWTTWQLRQELGNRMTQDDNYVYETIERPLLNVVADMHIVGGFDIDHEGLQRQDELYQFAMTKLDNAFEAVTGSHINLNSRDQLAKVLRNELDLPLHKLTNSKKRVSVDEAALRPIEHLHPAVGIALKYAELAKLIGTYIRPILKLDRLTSLWHQTGTRSGRFSASNRNLQNIPEAIRHYLRARQGQALLSIDLSQIEYRVAAHLSGDPDLIQAYLDDRDMHDETMRMFDITDRRLAKVFNFGGLLYGGSGEKISSSALKQGYHISAAEAGAFIQQAKMARPRYYRWAAEVGREAMATGEIKGLYGRTYRLRDTVSYEELSRLGRQAVNYPIQGGAADITKIIMHRTWRELGATIVAQVHDEIVYEASPEDTKDLAAEVLRIIEEVNPLCIPTKASVAIRETWK